MLVEKLDIWADFPELAEGQPESNQARTVWRWMQSGANRSPAQFPLTGKNTGNFLGFGLDTPLGECLYRYVSGNLAHYSPQSSM